MECYNTNKEKHVHEKRKRSGNIDEKKKKYINKAFYLIFGMFVCMLTGCSGKSGKEEKVTEIEILQYKQELRLILKKWKKSLMLRTKISA